MASLPLPMRMAVASTSRGFPPGRSTLNFHWDAERASHESFLKQVAWLMAITEQGNSILGVSWVADAR
jgi:hypothetical protein